MGRNKEAAAPGETEELISMWEKVLEDSEADTLDTVNFKHLIFDTYRYFYQFKAYNSVLRADLEIYKYAVRFCNVWGGYPNNCERYELATCLDFAEGLCRSIETGFQRGYYQISLPLGLSYHAPAGCSEPEADMSSYEAYEKAFRRELVAFMREYMEDDELDEQEELQKIAASRDTRVG